MATRSNRALGLSAIALAILFNIPFSVLASTYDYPDILRRSAAEALDRFAAGGPALILIWYGFALAALALAPLAIGLSITRKRIGEHPTLAIGAAIAGALAGVAQAIGLMRWVFVIPALARAHAAPGATRDARIAAEQAFGLLNAYGGVAIGEHLGQLLTALFVVQLAALQWGERARITASIGFVTVAPMVAGTGEGLALALGTDGSGFAAATIAAFMGPTLWLIATGMGRLRS